MGRASRAKKSKQALVASKKAVELPQNLNSRHLTMSEQLRQIPEFVAIFNKMDCLPPMDFFLSPAAAEIFETFYKQARKISGFQIDEQMRQAWMDLPVVAVEMAMSLHVLNSLAVGDSVPEEINRTSLEHGIEIAFNNFVFDEQRILPLGSINFPT